MYNSTSKQLVLHLDTWTQSHSTLSNVAISVKYRCHLKIIDIHKPCPFNYLCHSGVAAKAGSIHLIFSRPEGGAWPHQQQHHPWSCTSRTPISNQVLTWLATGTPLEAHKQSHKNHTASTRPPKHKLFHGWCRAHLISCVGGATPLHNHTHFTPLLPFLTY